MISLLISSAVYLAIFSIMIMACYVSYKQGQKTNKPEQLSIDSSDSDELCNAFGISVTRASILDDIAWEFLYSMHKVNITHRSYWLNKIWNNSTLTLPEKVYVTVAFISLYEMSEVDYAKCMAVKKKVLTNLTPKELMDMLERTLIKASKEQSVRTKKLTTRIQSIDVSGLSREERLTKIGSEIGKLVDGLDNDSEPETKKEKEEDKIPLAEDSMIKE